MSNVIPVVHLVAANKDAATEPVPTVAVVRVRGQLVGVAIQRAGRLYDSYEMQYNRAIPAFLQALPVQAGRTIDNHFWFLDTDQLRQEGRLSRHHALVQITFAREDFGVISVNNGPAAIAKAKEVKPDVAVIDIGMPGMDSYAVCQSLKGDPATANIPVLLLAGSQEPFDKSKASQSGANDHVVEPFETQLLIDKVKTLVGAPITAATAAPPAATVAAAPPAAAKPSATSPLLPLSCPAGTPGTGAPMPPSAWAPPPPSGGAPKPVTPAGSLR